MQKFICPVQVYRQLSDVTFRLEGKDRLVPPAVPIGQAPVNIRLVVVKRRY